MYDVIVLGVGGMGSSTCYALAKAGAKVLGIEQFQLGHDHGASHGETRIIRQAYFEHSDYVPLLKRSYELWDEVCQESGKQIFHQTGLVYYGSEKSEILKGVLESSQRYQIPIEEFSKEQARSLVPGIHSDGLRALREKDAGYLEVESGVLEFSRIAKKRGAEIREKETVHSVEEQSFGVKVKTDKGTYEARKVVITQGPWASEKWKFLTLHRQLLFWFEAPDLYLEKHDYPCFMFDLPYGFFYGFPKRDKLGIKIAHHLPGKKIARPENLSKVLEDGDDTGVRQCLTQTMPQVSSVMSQHKFCIYSMTPDQHFVIDKLPGRRSTYFACGFSGHGYKFASVVGEILSDLALTGKTEKPIELFRVCRFS